MKRIIFCMLMLLAFNNINSARAVPGPEPDDGNDFFLIFVGETAAASEPLDRYSTTEFQESLGWDFGSRIGYNCAWVEFFDQGAELFEVHYELVSDYPIPVEVNDRYGDDTNDQRYASFCGQANGNEVRHDGSDHFPHGTALTFFRQGVQIGEIDYGLEDPHGCDRGYWTPGNQPGEAWLWWDEDGPQEHAPGMPLDCGGGPAEPIPVLRAFVRNASPGVVYCTHDHLNGDDCVGPADQHPSRLSLKLRGHIRAFGDVRVPDGTTACLADRTVIVRRNASGAWKTVRRTQTNVSGHFSVHVRPREGRYRARVIAHELGTGGTCLAARSRTAFFG